MKTKLEMAHECALAYIKYSDGKTHYKDVIDFSWQYADAMQAEADKRKENKSPKVGIFERSDAVNSVIKTAEQKGLFECKFDFGEDFDINAWHAPSLKIGNFVEYSCKQTDLKYSLFVVEITPRILKLGAGNVSISHTIDGEVNGYDRVNEFIKRKGIKKLF